MSYHVSIYITLVKKVFIELTWFEHGNCICGSDYSYQDSWKKEDMEGLGGCLHSLHKALVILAPELAYLQFVQIGVFADIAPPITFLPFQALFTTHTLQKVSKEVQ